MLFIMIGFLNFFISFLVIVFMCFLFLIFESKIINLLLLNWDVILDFLIGLEICIVVVFKSLLLMLWLWLLLIFLKLLRFMNISVINLLLWIELVSCFFIWNVSILWLGSLVNILNIVIFLSFVVLIVICLLKFFSWCVRLFVVFLIMFNLFVNLKIGDFFCLVVMV